MNETKKNSLVKAIKFRKFFRYIDDLNSVNGGGEFETNCNYIYLEVLELGKENTAKLEASFFGCRY